MAAQSPEPVSVEIDGGPRVSALLQAPPGARLCYVLAHGAGVGMRHRSMEDVAAGLAERRIASFRFQFPYMERGSKRPDPPGLCHATVRAAVAEAARRLPGLAFVAGGRSFGGRMTAQAQAAAPLPGVRGLAFLAFPLHPAGRPSAERAKHLFEVTIPMLFLQGTRDALAELSLLRQLCEQLGSRATLELFAGADHSFHVAAPGGRAGRSGPREAGEEALVGPGEPRARTDAEVRAAVLDAFERWAATLTG